MKTSDGKPQLVPTKKLECNRNKTYMLCYGGMDLIVKLFQRFTVCSIAVSPTCHACAHTVLHASPVTV